MSGECRWCGREDMVEGSGYCGVCLAHLTELWNESEPTEDEEDEP